jgi:stage III sporulation protein AC
VKLRVISSKTNFVQTWCIFESKKPQVFFTSVDGAVKKDCILMRSIGFPLIVSLFYYVQCGRGGFKMEGVDLIFKIAAIGIIVAVLNQVLARTGREEQAMMITLAGIVVVLMMVSKEIAGLFQAVKTMFQF